MPLLKIEISGFKSFAEMTRISFCEGVIAIVGPNGCGKSNIVDALLWALGQQSAKTLRASSMQDVIFAGSLRRKAQSMAEVTVTLSNEKGLLPVDYQEVAITRRLFRDGESEYLINKQQVRLKDVVELLAHTGVGKESFAVIGQGKVAEVISQSPEDRRRLFEEVAGISHFLIKRNESARKLELAKANVARAKDITQEVEGQKKALEKQAHDAKRFQEQRQKLACYERLLCQSRFDTAKSACSALHTEHKEQSELLQKMQEGEANLKGLLLEKKEALKAFQHAYNELYEAEHLLERAIQAIKKDIDFCDEKKQTLSTQEKDSHSQLEGFDERIKKLESEAAGYRKGLSAKQEELIRLQKQKELTFNDWHKGFSELEALENSLKHLYGKRFSLQSRMQSCEADVKKSLLAEEVAKEKLQERLVQKEKLVQQRVALESEQEAAKKAMKEAVAIVESQKRQLEEKSQQLKSYVKDLEEHKRKESQMRQQHYEKGAKLKALSQLAMQMEGFTSSAKTLLQEAKKPTSPLFSKIMPLAEAVSLDHELLATLYDTSLLVFTQEDLRQALIFCEKLKGQEVAFVCLDLLGIKDPQNIREHFLQRMSHDLLLDNKYYVDAFGVVHYSKAKTENIFTRSKEIKELQRDHDQLSRELADIEEQMKLLCEKRDKLTADCQKLDQEMRKSDMQVVSSNFQLQGHERRLQDIVQGIERQDHEMASLKELTLSLKSQLKAKDDDFIQAKEALALLEDEFKASDAKTQTLRTTHASINEAKQRAAHTYDECFKQVEKDKHSLELVLVQKKELALRLEQELKLQKTIDTEQRSLDGRKQDIAKLLENKIQEKGQKAQDVAVKKEGCFQLEAEVKDIHQQQEILQTKKEACIKIHSQMSEKLAALCQELLSYDAVLQQEAPDGLAQFVGVIPTEEEVVRLKNAVERMRNVNLLAVEEHEAACERYDLLVKQLQDLEQAEKELIEIVGDLERESGKAFSQTFEEVRVAFKGHFQTLFQGGEADLILTEEQSGVDILAKPPGKQMRSMQLLSGGEKTLTALALLFACFDVRPSPFCILDEVDAPLDETNVERFGKLLKHFCDKTQFLVITHNKKTMQIADTLIGVSMAEKGVSQIISLDFKRRESPQDAVSVS